MNITSYTSLAVLVLAGMLPFAHTYAETPEHSGMAMPMEGIDTKAAAEAPVSDAQGDYTCPMHPHVHGKKGEDCPICGMHLVKAADGHLVSATEVNQ